MRKTYKVIYLVSNEQLNSLSGRRDCCADWSSTECRRPSRGSRGRAWSTRPQSPCCVSSRPTSSGWRSWSARTSSPPRALESDWSPSTAETASSPCPETGAGSCSASCDWWWGRSRRTSNDLGYRREPHCGPPRQPRWQRRTHSLGSLKRKAEVRWGGTSLEWYRNDWTACRSCPWESLDTIAIYAVLFLTLHSKQSPPWEFSGISALTTAQSQATVARPFLMMQSTPTQSWHALGKKRKFQINGSYFKNNY